MTTKNSKAKKTKKSTFIPGGELLVGDMVIEEGIRWILLQRRDNPGGGETLSCFSFWKTYRVDRKEVLHMYIMLNKSYEVVR